MNYKIEKSHGKPAYIQLYHFLVNDIVSGVYPYGSKLPSKRVIADDTGLSVITVEHAFDLLNEEGYVQSRERSGVYVIYRGEDFIGNTDTAVSESVSEIVSEAASRAGQPEKKETPLNAGDFPFSVIAKIMRRVLLDYGEKILVKSPNQGCPELKNEICHYLARSRGISIEPSQVIVGSGAEYLYGLIAQMLEPDSIVAIEYPSYSKIQSVYEAMGLTCDPLSMTQEGIPTEQLEKTRAKVLHVTPFNSFPTGITIGISKKHEYLRWVKKRKGILIEDNFDSELTVSKKMEEPLFSMDPDANVIYINTFSRTLAPSLRMGYIILPPGLLDLFQRKVGFYSCTVPIFDQYVLAELIKSGNFERHINRIRRKRRRKRVT